MWVQQISVEDCTVVVPKETTNTIRCIFKNRLHKHSHIRGILWYLNLLARGSHQCRLFFLCFAGGINLICPFTWARTWLDREEPQCSYQKTIAGGLDQVFRSSMIMDRLHLCNLFLDYIGFYSLRIITGIPCGHIKKHSNEICAWRSCL